MKVGNVYVNRDQIGAVVETQPFGGYGLSGTGPESRWSKLFTTLCLGKTYKVSIQQPLAAIRFYSQMTDKLKEYHLEERELYRKLPHLHNWWNKLYVAEKFGHLCGPGGTEIPETREYVIRPIYNLAGMGICTTIKL